jgi:hypothetical protein
VYYGLSPAIVNYLRVGDVEQDPLPLCIDDVPDYELRTALHEVCHLTIALQNIPQIKN